MEMELTISNSWMEQLQTTYSPLKQSTELTESRIHAQWILHNRPHVMIPLEGQLLKHSVHQYVLIQVLMQPVMEPLILRLVLITVCWITVSVYRSQKSVVALLFWTMGPHVEDWELILEHHQLFACQHVQLVRHTSVVHLYLLPVTILLVLMVYVWTDVSVMTVPSSMLMDSASLRTNVEYVP
jgi:hypothetical protein